MPLVLQTVLTFEKTHSTFGKTVGTLVFSKVRTVFSKVLRDQHGRQSEGTFPDSDCGGWGMMIGDLQMHNKGYSVNVLQK